jgi:hypothetical protein
MASHIIVVACAVACANAMKDTSKTAEVLADGSVVDVSAASVLQKLSEQMDRIEQKLDAQTGTFPLCNYLYDAPNDKWQRCYVPASVFNVKDPRKVCGCGCSLGSGTQADAPAGMCEAKHYALCSPNCDTIGLAEGNKVVS